MKAAFALLLFTLAGMSGKPSPIRLNGYLTTVVQIGSVPQEQREDFSAWVDESTFRIDVPSAVPGPRLSGGPCTNTTYVDPNYFFASARCAGLETIPVSIYRPDYPWKLGNCGVTTASAVWIALRTKDLFPAGDTRRPFAPPWTTTGEPLGLMTEAQYAWTDTGFEAEVRISNELFANWRKSPLRAAGLADPTAQPLVIRQLMGLSPDWLAGTLRMRQLTNLSGLDVPLAVDFVQFIPPEQLRGRKGGIAQQPQVNMHLRFTSVVPVSEAPAPLPLSGIIHVADFRLSAPELAVGYGQFATDRLVSLEIVAPARADFESKVRLAEHRSRVAVVRRVLTILIGVALVGAPILLFFWKTSGRANALSDKQTRH
jgi:hypothetical protein